MSVARRNTVPVRENPVPWALTTFGNRVDFLSPKPSQIDWRDIVAALDEVPRFTGHRDKGRVSIRWPVSKHLVFGCALLGPGEDDVRPYWLAHDKHEYVFGDQATPLARAHTILSGVDAGAIIKERLDVAIHAAFGLEWPAPPAIASRVKALDARALRVERAMLLPDHPDWPAQPITVYERICFEAAVSSDAPTLTDLLIAERNAGRMVLPEATR